MASLKRLAFNSKLCGRSIGMVEASSNAHAALVANLPYHEFNLVQAKVPTKETLVLNEMFLAGFQVCEGEIDLEFKVGENHESPMPAGTASSCSFACNAATTEDAGSLAHLAAAAFRGKTRFRKPWFSDQEVGSMYSLWVNNAITGDFDDVCLKVNDRDGQTIGLVTLRTLNKSDARIGLLAVRDTARRIGVGGFLVEEAKAWAVKQGCCRLFTATQMSNIDALRLYVRRGAVPIQTAYWLYRTANKGI